MLLERLLEFVTGVVGTERQGNRLLFRLRGLRASEGLIDEFQHGSDSLFDLVAAFPINLIRAANRVGDVLLEHIESLVKFTEQERLFGRLRIQEINGVDVAMRHAENVIGFIDHLGREHAAPLLRYVDAQFPQRRHGIGAGRLAIDRPHACREGVKVAAPFHRMPEQALRHRAATNVSRANEQNGLHSGARSFNLKRVR